jgi:hypothetical protein
VHNKTSSVDNTRMASLSWVIRLSEISFSWWPRVYFYPGWWLCGRGSAVRGNVRVGYQSRQHAGRRCLFVIIREVWIKIWLTGVKECICRRVSGANRDVCMGL